MKNLSPHRRFRGVSNYKASFSPIYRHPWPEDLPAQCPICGTKFITGFNLEDRTQANSDAETQSI